jgi:hypothetical protein
MKQPTTPEEYWDQIDLRNELNIPIPDEPSEAMSMMKKYVDNLICACSDRKFGQDAVEHAIIRGRFKPTYNLQEDLRAIMGDRSASKTPRLYDQFIEDFQQFVRQPEPVRLAA